MSSNILLEILINPNFKEEEKLLQLKSTINTDSNITNINKNGASLLHLAAEYGYVAICQWLINDYPNLLTARTAYGTNVLFYAAKSANAAVFDLIYNLCPTFLLEVNNQQVSILHCAVEKDNEEFLVKIIELLPKEFIIKEDSNQHNSILIAAGLGNKNAVLCLLNYLKSDVEVYAQQFNVAVQSAILNKKFTVFIILMDIYPDIIHKSLVRKPPFAEVNNFYFIHLAGVHRNPAVFDWLLAQHIANKTLPLVLKEQYGYRLIDLAANCGSLTAVQILLDYYPNNIIVEANQESLYLIHYAAKSGNVDLVEWLIQSGVDPTLCAKDLYYDYAVVHIAAIKGHIAILELLKQYKVTIHQATPNSGLYPLHLAIWNFKKEAVIWLLNNGASANQLTEDKYKNTPFHIAALINNDSVLDILAEHGANINSPNGQGYLPLHFAAVDAWIYTAARLQKTITMTVIDSPIKVKYNSFSSYLVVMLSNHWMNFFRKKVNHAFMSLGIFEEFSRQVSNSSVKQQDQKVINWLLAKQIDINQKTIDSQGDSVISLAILTEQLEALKFLHSKGANFEQTDNNGLLPLAIAIKQNNKAIVEWLLEKGVTVNHPLEQEKKLYPLQLAAYFDSADCIPTLLQYQSYQYWQQQAPYYTPLSIAISKNNGAVLRQLLENKQQINEQMQSLYSTWRGILHEPTADNRYPIHYLADIDIPVADNVIELTALDNLLTSGVNVNIQTLDKQETILHLLVNKAVTDDEKKLDNYMRLISLLIEKGLNIHIKNKAGKTAYDILLEGTVTNSLYRGIIFSLKSIMQELGINFNSSAILSAINNFFVCNDKSDFLEFLLNYFPEYYTKILMLKSLTDQLVLTYYFNNNTDFHIKTLLCYGFLIGHTLQLNEVDKLNKFFIDNNNSPEQYLALGLQQTNANEGNANIQSNGKLIYTANDCKLIDLTPNEQLRHLRVLSHILSSAELTLESSILEEARKLFIKLALFLPKLIEAPEAHMKVILAICDKLLDNLIDSNRDDVKQLHRTLYSKLYATTPPLLTLATNAITQGPGYIMNISTKENYKTHFTFFAKNSLHIKQKLADVLDKFNVEESSANNETSTSLDNSINN